MCAEKGLIKSRELEEFKNWMELRSKLYAHGANKLRSPRNKWKLSDGFDEFLWSIGEAYAALSNRRLCVFLSALVDE